MEYTVTKSNAELYKFRHPSGMYWADISIDCEGRKGRIQIASDYGTWQNYWGGAGPTFKEFLIQLNIEYAADKLNADRWFDHEATLEAWKRSVLSDRRRDIIDAETAVEIWNELKDLEGEYHETSFVMAVSTSRSVMEYFDHCPDLTKTISPQFKEFWRNVWPVFINELKKELNSAKGAVINTMNIQDPNTPQQEPANQEAASAEAVNEQATTDQVAAVEQDAQEKALESAEEGGSEG